MHLARTSSYIFIKALRLRFYLNPKVKSQEFLELIKVLFRTPHSRSSEFKSRTKPQHSDSLRNAQSSAVCSSYVRMWSMHSSGIERAQDFPACYAVPTVQTQSNLPQGSGIFRDVLVCDITWFTHTTGTYLLSSPQNQS